MENRIPLQALLSDGDNVLYIDFEVPIFIRTFWDTIKNREVFRLEEFLFNPEKPLVTSSAGWHTNEVIVIFGNEYLKKTDE